MAATPPLDVKKAAAKLGQGPIPPTLAKLKNPDGTAITPGQWAQILAEILALISQYLNPPAP